MTTPQSIFQGLAKDQTAQDIKAAIDSLATATDADQAASLAKLEAIRALLAAPLSVTGPATDAELRATPLPVSDSFSATLLQQLVTLVSGVIDGGSAASAYGGSISINGGNANGI